ncbi:MAG: DUF393 domain-containing protein [Gammaproteobacteria bacterium]|jgi:predicted DCC family thiol-disulfide oxidoreductase YuxK|nr:DUF393 domain-containing protein [Gammaproteobacteria bacterium]MBT4492978.1 DUF393 domain-containing protein [Gammaproteobacteria bacterium]
MQIERVVIFDGVCNFCSGAVDFIINRDPQAKFRFAPNQSNAGQILMERHQIQDLSDETLMLIEGDTYKLRTEAALAIAAELKWPWPLFTVFLLLPVTFRDYFYRVFARNRYRLFGKKNACMVPSADVRNRFLDDT